MKIAAIVASVSVALATAAATAQDAPSQGGQQGQKEGGQGGGQQRGGQGGGRGGQRGGAAGAAANVEGAMKGMNRGLKAIKAAVGDAAKKAEALKLVSEMQRDCAAAKSMPLPAAYTKGAADDAAKQKLEAEYAADMRKLMRSLLDLEDAIAADKADEAKALLAKIEEQREHSHKELGVD
jgi:Spy/CpxP family protein refolding chaperone